MTKERDAKFLRKCAEEFDNFRLDMYAAALRAIADRMESAAEPSARLFAGSSDPRHIGTFVIDEVAPISEEAWNALKPRRSPVVQGADFVLAPSEKSEASQKEARVTVVCSQCTASVSLPQRNGQVDIAALGLWYFSTPTGWRCPAHSPERTSDER